MMRQKEYIYLIDDLETTPRKQPDLESGGKVDMEGKRGGGGVGGANGNPRPDVARPPVLKSRHASKHEERYSCLQR
jgi:hypothetical protein